MEILVPGPTLEEIHVRDERFSALVLDAVHAVLRRALPEERSAASVSVDDLNLIPDMWAAEVKERLMPALEEIYYESAGRQAEVLSEVIQAVKDTPRNMTAAAGSFAEQESDAVEGDVRSEAGQSVEFLQDAENRLSGVGDDVWTNARSELVTGMQEGESVPNLAKRVQDSAGVSGKRATTIARTEVVGASNAGSIDFMRQSGVVKKKKWLATNDPRTRPTHAHASGQVVKLEDKFNVGGAKMDRPGAWGGPADEVINCRCTMTYITEENELNDPDDGDGNLFTFLVKSYVVGKATKKLARLGRKMLAVYWYQHHRFVMDGVHYWKQGQYDYRRIDLVTQAIDTLGQISNELPSSVWTAPARIQSTETGLVRTLRLSEFPEMDPYGFNNLLLTTNAVLRGEAVAGAEHNAWTTILDNAGEKLQLPMTAYRLISKEAVRGIQPGARIFDAGYTLVTDSLESAVQQLEKVGDAGYLIHELLVPVGTRVFRNPRDKNQVLLPRNGTFTWTGACSVGVRGMVSKLVASGVLVAAVGDDDECNPVSEFSTGSNVADVAVGKSSVLPLEQKIVVRRYLTDSENFIGGETILSAAIQSQTPLLKPLKAYRVVQREFLDGLGAKGSIFTDDGFGQFMLTKADADELAAAGNALVLQVEFPVGSRVFNFKTHPDFKAGGLPSIVADRGTIYEVLGGTKVNPYRFKAGAEPFKIVEDSAPISVTPAARRFVGEAKNRYKFVQKVAAAVPRKEYEATAFGFGFNPLAHAAREVQSLDGFGFNGIPKVVTEQEMDDLARVGGTELFSNLDAPSISAEQFRTGRFDSTRAMNGSGQIMQADTDGIFATRLNAVRALLPADARIAEMEDLQREMRTLVDTIAPTTFDSFSDWEKVVFNQVTGDPALFATMTGYDAIRFATPGGKTAYNVVNRSALTVQEAVKTPIRGLPPKLGRVWSTNHGLPREPGEMANLIRGDIDLQDRDAVLSAIQRQQKFDQLPTIRTEDELFHMAGAGEVIPVYRGLLSYEEGVPTADLWRQFMNGELFNGAGVYGNGTHFTTEKGYALDYAGDKRDNVFTAGLRSDANVIEYNALKVEIEAAQRELVSRPGGVDPESYEQAILNNPGRYAATRGYDAIRVDNEVQDGHVYIVLNRTAVVATDPKPTKLGVYTNHLNDDQKSIIQAIVSENELHRINLNIGSRAEAPRRAALVEQLDAAIGTMPLIQREVTYKGFIRQDIALGERQWMQLGVGRKFVDPGYKEVALNDAELRKIDFRSSHFEPEVPVEITVVPGPGVTVLSITDEGRVLLPRGGVYEVTKTADALGNGMKIKLVRVDPDAEYPQLLPVLEPDVYKRAEPYRIDQFNEDFRVIPTPDPSKGDVFMSVISEQQGFNGLPQIVPGHMLDDMLNTGEVKEVLFRGLKSSGNLTSSDLALDFRDGDMYSGVGVLGSGSYFDTQFHTATDWWDGQPGGLIRAGLRSDARVIDFDEASRRASQDRINMRVADPSTANTALDFAMSDPGRWAAMQGYDVIRDGTTHVVLNRTALVVEGDPKYRVPVDRSPPDVKMLQLGYTHSDTEIARYERTLYDSLEDDYADLDDDGDNIFGDTDKDAAFQHALDVEPAGEVVQILRMQRDLQHKAITEARFRPNSLAQPELYSPIPEVLSDLTQYDLKPGDRVFTQGKAYRFLRLEEDPDSVVPRAVMQDVHGNEVVVHPDGAGTFFLAVHRPVEITSARQAIPTTYEARYAGGATMEAGLKAVPYGGESYKIDSLLDVFAGSEQTVVGRAGLDFQEIEAVESYSRSAGPINFTARGTARPDTDFATVVKEIRFLDSALDKSLTIEDISGWRGIGNADAVFGPGASTADLTGLVFEEPGYSSISTHPLVSQSFGSGGVMMRVVMPRGSKAIRVTGAEYEILSPRNTQFRVVGDHRIAGTQIRVVDVEIIGYGERIDLEQFMPGYRAKELRPGIMSVETEDLIAYQSRMEGQADIISQHSDIDRLDNVLEVLDPTGTGQVALSVDDAGKIQGAIRYTIHTMESQMAKDMGLKSSVWIDGLATVRPGEGIGRDLVDKIENVARAHGAESISLEAIDESAGFWETLGYRRDANGNFTKELGDDFGFLPPTPEEALRAKLEDRGNEMIRLQALADQQRETIRRQIEETYGDEDLDNIDGMIDEYLSDVAHPVEDVMFVSDWVRKREITALGDVNSPDVQFDVKFAIGKSGEAGLEAVPVGGKSVGWDWDRGGDITDGAETGTKIDRAGISDDEDEALFRYLHDSDPVNFPLRGIEHEDAAIGAATVELLDAMMARSVTSAGISAWRGLGAEATGDSLSKIFGGNTTGVDLTGTVFEDSGFSSLTTDLETGLMFADQALMRVFLPGGSHAIRVGGGHDEILIPRGSRLRVVKDHGVLYQIGVRLLDVEVVTE